MPQPRESRRQSERGCTLLPSLLDKLNMTQSRRQSEGGCTLFLYFLKFMTIFRLFCCCLNTLLLSSVTRFNPISYPRSDLMLTTPWHMLAMTKTHKNTKTKCLKDKTCVIFQTTKNRGCNDFIYDIFPRNILPIKNLARKSQIQSFV